MTNRTGSCHCGALTIACEGEPKKISMCHCLDCQRRTGSTFGIGVFYDRDRVTVQGDDIRSFERGSASGSAVKFHFCGGCGSNVYWEPARAPALIGVAAGAFADSDLPGPEQSVWSRNKPTWMKLPDGVAVID